MIRDLARTVLLPWAVATAAMAAIGTSWGAVAAASAAVLGTALITTWLPIRAQRAQRARADEALVRIEAREAEAKRVSGLLQAELTSLRHQVTDARTDARRARLEALALTLELDIGDRRFPVKLRDLTLSELWVELTVPQAADWVPGLPAWVSLHLDGDVEPLGWALANRLLRRPEGHPPTWCLRWREPLRDHELPRPLWRAILHRDAHRVAPHPDARIWLHTPDGFLAAQLNDLSATGLGLTVPLGLRDAGRLPRTLEVTLDLPEIDDPLVFACELVHIDVQRSGAALGMRLDPADPCFEEVQPRLAAHVMRRDALARVRLVG